MVKEKTFINSLVKDVLMPLISVITGGIDFSEWELKLGTGKSAPVLHYGNSSRIEPQL